MWLLENPRTGEIFDDIGIEYCNSNGEVMDTTLVRELNIIDGDNLRVIAA